MLTGLLLAGLPAVGVLASRFGVPALRVQDASALYPLQIAAGFASLAFGVWQAVRANASQVDHSLALPRAARHLAWADHYASADPVSNGRLFAGQAAARGDRVPRHAPHGLPGRCHEVYGKGSLITDHNSYLANQDQLLPWLLNDLVAAAYGQDRSSGPLPRLVRDRVIEQVTQRRKRLIDWLIAARAVTLAVGFALWEATDGRLLAGTVNQAMHLADPHMSVGNLTARLAAIIPGHDRVPYRRRRHPMANMEHRVCQDCFENAKRYGDLSQAPEHANVTPPARLPAWLAWLRRKRLAAQ